MVSRPHKDDGRWYDGKMVNAGHIIDDGKMVNAGHIRDDGKMVNAGPTRDDDKMVIAGPTRWSDGQMVSRPHKDDGKKRGEMTCCCLVDCECACPESLPCVFGPLLSGKWGIACASRTFRTAVVD